MLGPTGRRQSKIQDARLSAEPIVRNYVRESILESNRMMFRIATLNLEQNHKRWEARRELVGAQFGKLRPDIWALNEVHILTQTGRWLQRVAARATGTRYALIQQSKARGAGSAVDPPHGRCFRRNAKTSDSVHAAARARRPADASGVAALRSLHRPECGRLS